MKKVVFACVHNAGRSQMAAALFNQMAQTQPADRDGRSERPVAVSAGTAPGDHVHPVVVDAMQEAGIDLSDARPQHVTEALLGGASLLVTMGCGDTCPYVPGLKTEDWPLEDPKGKPIERVREIRNEIAARVRELLGRL